MRCTYEKRPSASCRNFDALTVLPRWQAHCRTPKPIQFTCATGPYCGNRFANSMKQPTWKQTNVSTKRHLRAHTNVQRVLTLCLLVSPWQPAKKRGQKQARSAKSKLSQLALPAASCQRQRGDAEASKHAHLGLVGVVHQGRDFRARVGRVRTTPKSSVTALLGEQLQRVAQRSVWVRRALSRDCLQVGHQQRGHQCLGGRHLKGIRAEVQAANEPRCHELVVFYALRHRRRGHIGRDNVPLAASQDRAPLLQGLGKSIVWALHPHEAIHDVQWFLIGARLLHKGGKVRPQHLLITQDSHRLLPEHVRREFVVTLAGRRSRFWRHNVHLGWREERCKFNTVSTVHTTTGLTHSCNNGIAGRCHTSKQGTVKINISAQRQRPS